MEHKVPFFIFKSALSLFIAFSIVPAKGTFDQICADPNTIGSGGEGNITFGSKDEFNGSFLLKAGDRFSIRSVDIGGFIEVRNEARFNQGLLPNHNWRGYLSGIYSYPLIRQMQLALHLFTGFEHESSHATMGIAKKTDDPYAMVYDNTYRKSSLNSVPLGAQLTMYDQFQRLVVRCSGSWYFLSKNTPELPGLEVAGSGGFALSGMYRYRLRDRFILFAAVHDRFIFTGPTECTEYLYVNGEDGLIREERGYPIMNRMNTVTVVGGISLPLFQSRRLLDVYLRYLYGHIYGYVDSRDVRSVLSLGVLLRGW